MGSNVYIRTDIYKRIVERGHDAAEYVNEKVKEALDREEAGGTEKG